jgi:4-amino-4-deoxy-L-arabinose transferase-like glycosyltransferase
MGTIDFNKQYIKGEYVVVFVVFLVIALSRLFFPDADLTSTALEIEEKPGGFNARNKVLFGVWPIYSNWMQPMVYVPLANMISYISFSLFGVGLVQFRLPFILFGILGLAIFYLIVYRKTNQFIAITFLLLYATDFNVFFWNRSALPENIFLFLMPLSVYFFSKAPKYSWAIFLCTFFGSLNLLVKVDSYPFVGALLIFFLIWSVHERNVLRTGISVFFGLLATLLVALMLFYVTDSFNFIVPMYSVYFNMFSSSGSLITKMAASFPTLLNLFKQMNPYICLVSLMAVPILVKYHKRMDRVDYLLILVLILTIISRLLIPPTLIYWKRVMFMYMPILYLCARAMFFLYQEVTLTDVTKAIRSKRAMFIGISIIPASCCLTTILVLSYLFREQIGAVLPVNHTTNNFFNVMFLVMAGLSISIFLSNSRSIKYVWLVLVAGLISSSVIADVNIIRERLAPSNIKYGYEENRRYTTLIPENELVVADEQGFRAFAYLTKHQFFYNHDGGPNPINYREVLERDDVRYFIFDINAYGRTYWGIPNKVRLILIKDKYPKLKLLDVMSSSGIPMAIYDKYGGD